VLAQLASQSAEEVERLAAGGHEAILAASGRAVTIGFHGPPDFRSLLVEWSSMSDNQADVSVEFEGLTGYLVFTCANCGENRHSMRGLHPGNSIHCRCGQTTVQLTGDSFDQTQRTLDDLDRTLKSLFK